MSPFSRFALIGWKFKNEKCDTLKCTSQEGSPRSDTARPFLRLLSDIVTECIITWCILDDAFRHQFVTSRSRRVILTLQCLRLASASRDLLWTDKYTPRNSGEILGNMAAVKKVKSWLVEWKQRTDLEMRKLRKEQMKQAKKEGKTKEEMRKSELEVC